MSMLLTRICKCCDQIEPEDGFFEVQCWSRDGSHELGKGEICEPCFEAECNPFIGKCVRPEPPERCGHSSHAYDRDMERYDCCGTRECRCACREVESAGAPLPAIPVDEVLDALDHILGPNKDAA